jgi:hyperosmotically inducible protein
MHISKNTKLVGISMLLVFGLGACNKPGPAETAGKNIDRTMEQAGQKIESTADKVGDKIGDAAHKVGDKVENTADKVENKISAQGAKAGVAVADTEITTKVKAAILAEAGLKTLQISVETMKGVVTLSGSVDSQTHSNAAKSLASAVSGVNSVKNELVVKPGK